jgi:hypothetical protein
LCVVAVRLHGQDDVPYGTGFNQMVFTKWTLSNMREVSLASILPWN